MMAEKYPLEVAIITASQRHVPDQTRIGCSCGFCAWSPEHVAIMAYREAMDAEGRP